MNLGLVPTATVPKIWPAVEEIVSRATSLSDGRYTAPDVRDRLLLGMAQLWIAAEGTEVAAAMVSEFETHPGGKVCRIWLCAGENVGGWIPFIGTVEHWAASEGCAWIEIIGRKGWRRLLPDYAEPAVYLQKRIA